MRHCSTLALTLALSAVPLIAQRGLPQQTSPTPGTVKLRWLDCNGGPVASSKVGVLRYTEAQAKSRHGGRLGDGCEAELVANFTAGEGLRVDVDVEAACKKRGLLGSGKGTESSCHGQWVIWWATYPSSQAEDYAAIATGHSLVDVRRGNA